MQKLMLVMSCLIALATATPYHMGKDVKLKSNAQQVDNVTYNSAVLYFSAGNNTIPIELNLELGDLRIYQFDSSNHKCMLAYYQYVFGRSKSQDGREKTRG